MPRVSLPPRLLTGLSWLILGVALALLFVSWDPYTLRTWFNADNLQMIGLFYDLTVYHYPITSQSLSQAMYWFPDVLVQGLMASLSGFNPAFTLMGGGWVIAMATIATGHGCLQRLIPDTTPCETRQRLMFNLNILIAISMAGLLLMQPMYRWTDPALHRMWFPHMLLWPCFHNGVILMTLMALWMSLKRFAPEFPSQPAPFQWGLTLGYTTLMLIGTLSDGLLVMTWTVPLTLVIGLNRNRRSWLGWTWLGVGLAMGLIALWQRVGYFTSVSITWVPPAKSLLHWLIIAQTAPVSIWLGLALAVTSGLGLMLLSTSRKAGVALLVSLGITLTVVILAQMMQDFQGFRYLLPFMGLGLWIMAWAASWGLTQLKAPWSVLSSAMFLASLVGVVYLSVTLVSSTRLNQVLQFNPPTTPCLNALGPRFNHSVGLAEYWVDRPNELFTIRPNLRLLTVYSDGRPRHWLNNKVEWIDPADPYRSRPIHFVVMSGLDPSAVQATWGPPDEVITCRQWPELQFWVFNPPRRFRDPLAKPLETNTLPRP